MLPWQRQLRQLNYQKTDVCVVNLLSAIFGDQRIKGFREKDEWTTGIKYCVQPLSAISSDKKQNFVITCENL